MFVDTDLFVYAVGRPHPLREPSRAFFETSAGSAGDLVTSAEVMQELLHLYARQRRRTTLDAALRLITSIPTIWPVTPADVLLARSLADRHPDLRARDLVHLACCRRRGVASIRTYDADPESAVAAGP